MNMQDERSEVRLFIAILVSVPGVLFGSVIYIYVYVYVYIYVYVYGTLLIQSSIGPDLHSIATLSRRQAGPKTPCGSDGDKSPGSRFGLSRWMCLFYNGWRS
jgi:hypothetical protein